MSAVNSKKVTPEKTFMTATVAAAAKLLGSAKKSQNRRHLGRMKLSLKKQRGHTQGDIGVERGPTAEDGSSGRPAYDFSDSSEFQKSFLKQNADRKRRKSSTTEDESKCKKLLRHDEFLSQTNDIHNQKRKGFYTEHLHLPTKADISSIQDCYVQLNMKIDQTPVKIKTRTEDGRCARSPGIGQSSPMSEDQSSTCKNQDGLSTRVRPSPCRRSCLSPQLDNSRDTESLGDETNGHETRAGRQPLLSRNSDDLIKDDVLIKDYVFCQLCQKDLSHLNSHRRTLHINKCIDKDEENKRLDDEMAKMLEAAKHQVLDCPICGKHLKTEASRKSHVKKCASINKVGIDQLMGAVKRQKEEHLASLETGQLPDCFRMGRAKKQNTASRGVVKHPKSKLDEDTQLAMAISSSLQDDGVSLEPLTSGAPAATISKKGRKLKQCDECLLVKLTREQAADRIAGRVEHLLAQQEEEDDESIPSLPSVDKTFFNIERLQQICWSAESASSEAKMFWRHAALEDIVGELKAVSHHDFYAPALMPPVTVSKRPLSSMTGRAAEIPGRQRSECFRPSVELNRSVELSEGFLVPSTQTAALLADMAAEADVDMKDESFHSTPSAFGFPDLQRQAREDLLSAFSSLVNQPLFSDIRIVAAGNVTLFAHCIVLHARCPALLQLKAHSGVAELKDFPAACILAVLRHLYSGCLDVDSEYLAGTVELAFRLGLSTLAEYCIQKLQRLSLTLAPGCDGTPVAAVPDLRLLPSLPPSHDQAAGKDLRLLSLPPSYDQAAEREPFAVRTLEQDHMEGASFVCTPSSVGSMDHSKETDAVGGLLKEAANGRPAVDGEADKASSRMGGNDAQKLSRSLETDIWPEKLCWNKTADSADVVIVDDELTMALNTQASIASPVLPRNLQIFSAKAAPALDHSIDAKGKNETYPACKTGSDENADRQISISNTQNLATFIENYSVAPNLTVYTNNVSDDFSKCLQSSQTSVSGATTRDKSDEDGSSFSNLDDELLLAVLCEDVLAACNIFSQEEISSENEQGLSDVGGGAHLRTQGTSDVGGGAHLRSGKTMLDSTGPGVCLDTCTTTATTMLDSTGQDLRFDGRHFGTCAKLGKTMLDSTGQGALLGTCTKSAMTMLDSTGSDACLGTCTKSVQGENNSCRTELVIDDECLYLREGQNSQKELPVDRGALVQKELPVDRGALQGTDNADGGGVSVSGFNHSQLKQTGATEIESIEVSDDDLFSRDEIDVSPLQSTPKHSSQRKKNLSANCTVRQDFVPVTGAGSSSEDILIYSSDDSDESAKHLSGKSPVVDKTFNNAEMTASQTLSFSVPTPPSRPEFKDLQSSVPVDKFPSLNLSNIESSRKISSETPDNHFKTSTPVSSCILQQQQNTASSQSQVNFPIKVFSNRAFASAVSEQRENYVRCSNQESELGSTSYKMTNNCTNVRVHFEKNSHGKFAVEAEQLRAEGTKDHNSLLMTPVTSNSKVRKTFQVVIPDVHQLAALPTRPSLVSTQPVASEQKTPEDCVSSQRQDFQCRTVSALDSDGLIVFDSDGLRQGSLQRNPVGISPGKEDGDCEHLANTSDKQTSKNESGRGSADLFDIYSSDSDVEIIPSQALAPPSPKFTRITSTQHGLINREDKPAGLLANRLERAVSGCDDISAHKEKQNHYQCLCHGGRAQCEPQSLTLLGSRSEPPHSLEKNNSMSMSNISHLLDSCDQKSHSLDHNLEQSSCDRVESGSSLSLTAGEQDVWEGFDHLDDHNPYFDPLSQSLVMPSPYQLICQERDAKIAEERGKNLCAGGGAEGRGLRELNTSNHSNETLKAGDKLPTTSQFKTPSKLKQFSGDKMNCRLMSGSSIPTSSQVLLHHSSHRETGWRRLRSSRAPSESFSVDEEAANSSYLWSEENAPTDEVSAGQTVPNIDSKTVQHAATPTMSTCTMSAASKKGGKSAWVPPSPFTPMPPFDNMNTPALKNEVNRYGLKPVGKKRMRRILKDIYQKTHQYETDSDCSGHDEDCWTSTAITLPGKDIIIPSEPMRQTAGREKLKEKKQTAAAKRENVGIKQRPLGRHKQPSIKVAASMPSKSANHDIPRMVVKRLDKNKWDIQTGKGLLRDMGRLTDRSPEKGTVDIDKGRDNAQLGAGSEYSSSPEKGSHSSQDSSESGVPDVSVFELAEHNDSDDDEMTLSQKVSTAKDLHNSLMNFFKTNKDVRTKVLLYEPLDLGVLKNEIKSAGVKCSNEKLLNFLDEKCITFTTKNMVPRHRRNRGKTAKTNTVYASQK